MTSSLSQKDININKHNPITNDNIINAKVPLLLEDDSEIFFSTISHEYCICFIDIVNSTNFIANLMNPDKVRKYYSIFLNVMSKIIKGYDGKIIKNIGDSLLYYFPKTEDITDKYSFQNVIECSLTLILAHELLSSKLSKEGLPCINYRISCDYGKVEEATINNKNDLFGSIVNTCSKINMIALPNNIIIGTNLYAKFKSFNFEKIYKFEKITNEFVINSISYPLFSIVAISENEENKEKAKKFLKEFQSNYNDFDSNLIKSIEEEKDIGSSLIQQSNQINNSTRRIMIIDDDEDVLFTYKKMLCNEGFKVITFLDPYEALKTFSLVKDPNFYQLIIMDIRMIGMNGFQLFYKFKNINKNIKILLVSALEIQEESISILPDLASHDVLKKPIAFNDFLNAVKVKLTL